MAIRHQRIKNVLFKKMRLWVYEIALKNDKNSCFSKKLAFSVIRKAPEKCNRKFGI